MNFIKENIKTIRDYFGLSYSKFAETISASLQIGKYSKDKVYNFEKGITDAEKDQVFLRLLSEMSGIKEADLIKKKIKSDDLKTPVIHVEDIMSLMGEQQIKILAYLRTILGLYAELQAPVLGVSPDSLKDHLIQTVEEQVLELKKGLKQKE
jgi:hypothetical protein